MIWDTRKLILEQDGRLILSEDPLTLKVSHVMLCHIVLVWGGGGKALTMTMTPWNLTHGQWSKNLTMATLILECAPWSMVKMVIL